MVQFRLLEIRALLVLISVRLSIPLPEVPTFNFVHDMLVTFDTVRAHLPPSEIPAFNAWKSTSLEETLCSVKSYSKADVPALMSLLYSFSSQTYFEW